MGGTDMTGSHQFCRVAAESSGCVPVLAPGNRAHWAVLGRQMTRCRKQTVVPDGVPRDQLGSPRKCHGVSLPVWQLLRSLCSSSSAVWSNSQAPVPTPARGNAAGCEVGSGTPAAVLSHSNCSLATHLPQLQDLLCCCFLGGIRPGLAGWGYFGHRQLHSSYLCFPSFEATIITLLGPTGSWLQGLRAFQGAQLSGG